MHTVLQTKTRTTQVTQQGGFHHCSCSCPGQGLELQLHETGHTIIGNSLKSPWCCHCIHTNKVVFSSHLVFSLTFYTNSSICRSMCSLIRFEVGNALARKYFKFLTPWSSNQDSGVHHQLMVEVHSTPLEDNAEQNINVKKRVFCWIIHKLVNPNLR